MNLLELLVMYQHYIKIFGVKEGKQKAQDRFADMGVSSETQKDIAACFNKEGHAIDGTNAVTTFTFD